MPTGRVLCLGDDFVAGLEQLTTGHRSPRGPLQQLLSAAGYATDFVGTQSSQPAGGGTDPHHDGYAEARMRSADDATGSIEARVPAIRTAVGAVDIIVLIVGWADVVAGTADIAAKYTGLLPLIQTGTWASARMVLVTLAPEPSKTVSQTNSDRPLYAALNAAIRDAASSTRAVIDLASLSGDTSAAQSALVEKLIFDATHGPEATTRQNGQPLQAPFGGHFVTSWAAIRDFCAEWRQTPWRRGGNGGTAGLAPNPSVVGHPYFVDSVHAITPWFWVFAGPGHASSNAVVEVRNLSAQALRASTEQWEFFFEGARPGTNGQNSAVWEPELIGGTPPLSDVRADGITSYYRTSGGTNIESWPNDTSPSRGIQGFIGGSNRSLMTDARCFAVAAQMRLALLDPSGPDDRAQSRYVVACGFDAYAGAAHRYDYWGWPLEAMDGGHCRWQILRSSEWTPIGSLSLGRTTPTWQGRNDEEHFEDPGVMPPHAANYEYAHPFNDIGTYSLTASQVRANPPRLPRFWTLTGGAPDAAAWVVEDYWMPPGSATRAVQWSAQGAERVARVIYSGMLGAGWLATFDDGDDPVAPMPLPGMPDVGRWSDVISDGATTPPTATWAATGVLATVAPAWAATVTLPAAVVGAAYSHQVVASGSPPPTYSIVSGPSWLGINATTGALSGTAQPPESDVIVIVRASNGTTPDADLIRTLSVVGSVSITTTTLPMISTTVYQAASNSFKSELLRAIHDFSAGTGDTFKIALYTANAALVTSATVYTPVNEVVGAGYVAGGIVLSPTVSEVDGVGIVDFADANFGTVTLNYRFALIYNATKANRAIAVFDFGATFSVTNGNLTLQMPPPTPTTAAVRIV